MGRSRETYGKKEVRSKKEKKRKEKEQKRLARKEEKEKNRGLDDMIAYVNENGVITSTPPDPNRKKTEIAAEDIEISVSKSKSITDTDDLRQGKLTNFNESKGYGFIRDSESDMTFFVHINDFLDDIKVEDKVTYRARRGKKGPVAVDVSLLK